MPKKIVAVLLVFLMAVNLFSLPAFAEDSTDDSSLAVETLLLSTLDMAAYEWYEDKTSRATLATCIWLDTVLSEHEALTDIIGKAAANGYIYVSKNGLTLSVVFFSKEGTVLATYTPATDSLLLDYIDISVTTSFAAQAAMDSLEEDGLVSSYYQIEGEDMITVAEVIVESLTE